MSSFVRALRLRFLTRLYDPLAEHCFGDTRRKRRLISLGPPAAGERVLDLGGGTGTLAALIVRSEAGCRVVVADIDIEMLATARRRARDSAGRLALVCASADALPLATGGFDRAFSSLAFHHFPPAVKVVALAELHRVLRSGCAFLLLDFDRPRDPVMRLVSVVARLLDGWSNTADNFAGRLPALMTRAGFAAVRERRRERTPFGVLAYHTATRA